MSHYLLAIDQGTTSTRAIIFDNQGQIIAESQQELTQYFPEPGWVEHDAEEIWQHTLQVCRNAISQSQLHPCQITSIGIANQRETTVIWDKETGVPIHRAIVWQDRRTESICSELVVNQLQDMVSLKTGLTIDPYFSASKIRWLLDNVKSAREQTNQHKLLFGTIDSYLLWRLTNGRLHATDATNAARTLLFNIHKQDWDEELCRYFHVPMNLLPIVKNTADDYGVTEESHFGAAIPIGALVGDQQAALVGHLCFKPGMMKTTYGTGCFMMMNTGKKVVKSQHALLATVAYRLKGEVTYALEGSIFIAGAAVQWLRDALKLIKTAGETEERAQYVADNGGVYLVPAFSGMGAPYWDPEARGAILGLTRDSGVNHIVRAALESVCYQSRDLLLAMRKDGAGEVSTLRVDGGMVSNDWLMQFLADMLDVIIEKPAIFETTALGAAMLAGLEAGVFGSLIELQTLWKPSQQFTPAMPATEREALYSGWLTAVAKICCTNQEARS